MKVASLTKVKNDLSRYVEEVRRGGRVRILVRGVPAADLVPLAADPASPGNGFTEEEIAALESRGIIRRGKRGRCAELERSGPRVEKNAGTRALLDERRAGR